MSRSGVLTWEWGHDQRLYPGADRQRDHHPRQHALIAIGFSLIYGIVRLINFAHGDIVTIGAFAMLASVVVLNALLRWR